VNTPKLLIVEDDTGVASQYRWALPGYSLLFAPERQQAISIIQKEMPALALVDLGLPPDRDGVSEGFAVLEESRRLAPDMKSIVVTGNSERQHAIRAISEGACDFCEKPVDGDVLKIIVDRAFRLYSLECDIRSLTECRQTSGVERIITGDAAMLRVCRDVEKLAATDVPVLLLGESGTGKEALARALHSLGPRARKTFVAINCGAIPETLLESELFGYERGAFTGAVKQTIGKIESADGGTLFLDEIGDLPAILQVKLLRFLQDQMVERIGGRRPIQVDVRIVSATNKAVEDQTAASGFRSDLLYRLNAVTVRIPPLREREGDAVLLARHFLNEFNRAFQRRLRGFTEAAVAAIADYEWPGNVRELENRVKRAVVMAEGRVIDVADLELSHAKLDAIDLDLRTARMKAERHVLQAALARSNGTRSVAAKLLGISRPTLYELMELHGLSGNNGSNRPGSSEDGS
jgi:two-component system, NtrC family, response regulator